MVPYLKNIVFYLLAIPSFISTFSVPIRMPSLQRREI